MAEPTTTTAEQAQTPTEIASEIVIGIDYHEGDENEGASDHYVSIRGRGYDETNGLVYYTYFESGTSYADIALDDDYRLYYDPVNNTFGNISQPLGDYNVTTVIPNIGVDEEIHDCGVWEGTQYFYRMVVGGEIFTKNN